MCVRHAVESCKASDASMCVRHAAESCEASCLGKAVCKRYRLMCIRLCADKPSAHMFFRMSTHMIFKTSTQMLVQFCE